MARVVPQRHKNNNKNKLSLHPASRHSREKCKHGVLKVSLERRDLERESMETDSVEGTW
jgi:DNA-binding cell septation regulator SpoVG